MELKREKVDEEQEGQKEEKHNDGFVGSTKR